MAAKHVPTNGDLSKKLADALSELRAMRVDVNGLLEWKLHEDAYKAALKSVKQDEEANLKDKVWKQVLYVLGLIGVVLVTYLATKGVHG